jgi:hypothetical protein
LTTKSHFDLRTIELSVGNARARVSDEVAMIRARWPSAWENGARCGFEGERDSGSYPTGFHAWPLDRRNSWYSGYNRGYCDRLRHASEKEA